MTYMYLDSAINLIPSTEEENPPNYNIYIYLLK